MKKFTPFIVALFVLFFNTSAFGAYFNYEVFVNETKNLQTLDFSEYSVGDDIRFQNVDGFLFFGQNSLMLDGDMHISPANMKDEMQIFATADNINAFGFSVFTVSENNTNFSVRIYSDTGDLADGLFYYTFAEPGEHFLGFRSDTNIKFISIEDADTKKMVFGDFVYGQFSEATPVPLPGSLYMLGIPLLSGMIAKIFAK